MSKAPSNHSREQSASQSETEQPALGGNLAQLITTTARDGGRVDHAGAITENLDIWTAAIQNKASTGRGSNKKQELYGIKKLRELILELAVRGLLVPQDPNEEPASTLLEKIAAEKERLIKDGKVKKQKKLPPLSEDNKLFELPKGWQSVQFGKVAEIERGGSPRPIKSFLTDDPKGLNWIKIGDTEQGGKYITSANERIRKEGLAKTRMVYPGDFLLTNSMSFGRPYITQIEGCIHDGWLRISPPERINKDYLYLLLSSPFIVNAFKKAAAGAVVLNLNADKVREVEILIPPEAEQPRVVAKVDELMALCDQLEQQTESSLNAHQILVETLLKALLDAAQSRDDASAFEQAWQRIADHFDVLFTTEHSIDQLKQTILQLAVMGKLVPQDPNDEPASVLLEKIAAEKDRLVKEGKIKKQKKLPPISEEEKPFELPEGWEFARLESLAELITKGSSPKWQGVSYTEDPEDVLFVTSENVGAFELKLDTEKYVEKKFNEVEPRSILKKNDILMNIVGASIGRTAIYDIERLANINQAVCLIRMFSECFSMRYMLMFFNSEVCVSYMYDKQVDNARANLSMGNIAKFVIPLPTRSEQDKIVEKVDALIAICDSLKADIRESQTTQLHLADAMAEKALG